MKTPQTHTRTLLLRLYKSSLVSLCSLTNDQSQKGVQEREESAKVQMVKVQGRFRVVAAAFNEVARLRPSDSSSGSDHSPDDPADLSDLVESFIESEGKLTELPINDNKTEKSENKIRGAIDSSDDEEDDAYEDVKNGLSRLLGGSELVDEDDSGERRRITDDVEFACGIIGEIEDTGYKRKLMTHLRNKGFDSGLCKSKWERFGRCPAGKYEYVDIKINGDGHRYIIELNLTGEFEIARPTTRYTSLLALMPRVFVGKPKELKQVVRIMCNEMRLSMKRAGMHAPPWRRNGYMQAKWFGHYKRTVNEASRVKVESGEHMRRWVGFEELSKTAAF